LNSPSHEFEEAKKLCVLLAELGSSFGDLPIFHDAQTGRLPKIAEDLQSNLDRITGFVESSQSPVLREIGVKAIEWISNICRILIDPNCSSSLLDMVISSASGAETALPRLTSFILFRPTIWVLLSTRQLTCCAKVIDYILLADARREKRPRRLIMHTINFAFDDEIVLGYVTRPAVEKAIHDAHFLPLEFRTSFVSTCVQRLSK
jgi:hypothetical protein